MFEFRYEFSVKTLQTIHGKLLALIVVDKLGKKEIPPFLKNINDDEPGYYQEVIDSFMEKINEIMTELLNEDDKIYYEKVNDAG